MDQALFGHLHNYPSAMQVSRVAHADLSNEIDCKAISSTSVPKVEMGVRTSTRRGKILLN